jgi:Xaa-Pro aminopeptidase
MSSILLYGDSIRSPALRHEVPVAILDPFLFVAHDGRSLVLTSSLEGERILEARPDAELLFAEDLGFYELVQKGLTFEGADLETVIRAVSHWGLSEVVVPGDLPVAVADRLRAAGVGVMVDSDAVKARRRVKSAAELKGIARAQRAAEAGMAAGETLIRGAARDGDRLVLTAEEVRDAIRSVCAAAGAPAPPDIMVVSAWTAGGGHDPGSGPLPADLPIEIDLWPCDEASGCWADMTRTFVNGVVSDEVARLREIVREALEAARAAARPGITGGDLYGVAASVIEAAGYPTQRTRAEGERLTHGFYFGLGHGVGLDVHEAPWLGNGSQEVLVAGDVVAIEPGIEGLDGIGGVRYEDVLLITEDGCETLTRYAYDL